MGSSMEWLILAGSVAAIIAAVVSIGQVVATVRRRKPWIEFQGPGRREGDGHFFVNFLVHNPSSQGIEIEAILVETPDVSGCLYDGTVAPEDELPVLRSSSARVEFNERARPRSGGGSTRTLRLFYWDGSPLGRGAVDLALIYRRNDSSHRQRSTRQRLIPGQ